MKIIPGQINKLYGSLAADNAASTPRDESKQHSIDKDKMFLSDAARGRSEIDAAAMRVVSEATQPASAERLLRYKNEIQSGTYRVSSEDIASAMLDGGSQGSDS